ncbi:MAG: hypothetical protein ABR84_04080 [Cryomorphaceae bacterium BACL21 MAG-121220-bin10]|jgi:hypothetical protein|nr:MAG: hypothetical protein ABR84_04080 [Cryomorphaceae bacterium BACL21 MAG-121220-bin10]
MHTKQFFIAAVVLMGLMISCGETKTNDVQDPAPKVTETQPTPFSGEYYYSNEGAVLKGKTFIYAVTMDDWAKELGERIAPVKQDAYDMVPVMVLGIVTTNPAFEQGQQVWEQIITISDIISIADQPAEAEIKIEEAN